MLEDRWKFKRGEDIYKHFFPRLLKPDDVTCVFVAVADVTARRHMYTIMGDIANVL